MEGVSEFIHSSFRLLLEIYHLECQRFQDQDRLLYQQMLQRVVSMPWQIKARYVPLCAVVPYVGSQQVGKAGGWGGSVLAGSAARLARPLSAACHLALPSSAMGAGSLPSQGNSLYYHPRENIEGVVVVVVLGCRNGGALLGTASWEGSFAC